MGARINAVGARGRSRNVVSMSLEDGLGTFQFRVSLRDPDVDVRVRPARWGIYAERPGQTTAAIECTFGAAPAAAVQSALAASPMLARAM